MTPTERAIGALRTQLQFELVEIGGEVARAAALVASEQRHADELAQHCEAAAHQISALLTRSQLNAALLETTRRLFSGGRQALRKAQQRLTAAQEREDGLRTRLTGLRNRDRSLERAAHSEHRKQRLEQQRLDVIVADDLWMQRPRSES